MTLTVENLFRPQSIAVIGASTDPKKTAGRPLKFLKNSGFNGEIWPVNPRANTIHGIRCFSNIDKLPGVPDVAIILLGPSRTKEAVGQLASIGTKVAVVLGGGYSEIGAKGSKRQLALTAASGSMRILGPNTIGILNLRDNVILSASGAIDNLNVNVGKIGIISQSGGILGSLLSRAAAKGIGLSHLVSTGNEGDLEICDLLDWMIDQPDTTVIGLYLEVIRNPKRFLSLTKKAKEAEKKLVVYKVGRSKAGQLATASHTGAMAGDDRLYDAIFAQSDIIRVKRFDEILDIAITFSAGRISNGRRVAILTSTGGAGSLIADQCGLAGFKTQMPSRKTAAQLSSIFTHVGFSANSNPIDLTLAGLSPKIVEETVNTLLQAQEFDVVIPIVGSSGIGRPELIADPVIRAISKTSKPLIVYCSPSTPEILHRLNSAGVPTFETPESCGLALTALLRN